jgi:hypothetical protein
MGLYKDNVIFTESVLTEDSLKKLGSAPDIFIDYRKHSAHKMFSGNAMRAVTYRKPAVMYDCVNVDHIPRGVHKVKNVDSLAKGIINLFNNEDFYSRLEEEISDLYQERKFSRIARQTYNKMEEMF